MMPFDVHEIRKDFPVLKRIHIERPVVYLDNACTTLKPLCVTNAMLHYYHEHPSCHSRSVHLFGRETTEDFAAAREAVQRFIGADRPEEIIFTKNATEALNLVARGLSFRDGDTVLCFEASHNSDLLPWLRLKQSSGVFVEVIPSLADTSVDIDKFLKALKSGSVRLVSFPHVSNVSGITLPVQELCAAAHEHGALVLVDGTQAVAYANTNVRELGVDFYAFSAHKMLGPTDIGCLYGRYELLDQLDPLLLGGDSVLDVNLNEYELAPLPGRLEAGTQDYAGAIGYHAAIEYLKRISPTDITRHLQTLNVTLTESLMEIPRIRIIGPADARARGAIFNFIMEGVDSYDIVRILDASENIMLRAGRHCAHTWFHRLCVPPSVRASFYIYNTVEEVELLAMKLKDIARYF